jgi:hypothetical protein
LIQQEFSAFNNSKSIIEVQNVAYDKEAANGQPEESANGADQDCNIPYTPIKVMQQVGLCLGIEAAKLTKEKLKASSSNSSAIASSNDD